MKIALVPGVFFPQPGGAQVQTHNLANKLIQMGHEVDILLLNKTNPVECEKRKHYKLLFSNPHTPEASKKRNGMITGNTRKRRKKIKWIVETCWPLT